MRDPFYDNCICCHGDAGDYLVYYDVWTEEAHLDAEDGQVCLSCLEYRIGRRLEPSDFFPFPSTVNSTTPEVIDRIGAPMLELYSDGTTNVDKPLYYYEKIGTLYTEPMFYWYLLAWGSYNTKMATNFVRLEPGRHDSSKRVVLSCIDFPLAAMPVDSRGVYDLFDGV